MKSTRILSLLFASLTLFGCTLQSNEELLAKKGITGEHALKHPKETSALKGSLSGAFFLGTGAVTGDVETTSKIMFSWCPKTNVIVSSEFPKGMFVVNIDNTKKEPSVELLFNKNWLTITDPIREASTWDSVNVNAIISASNQLQAIRVKISEADLKNEPALPQL